MLVPRSNPRKNNWRKSLVPVVGKESRSGLAEEDVHRILYHSRESKYVAVGSLVAVFIEELQDRLKFCLESLLFASVDIEKAVLAARISNSELKTPSHESLQCPLSDRVDDFHEKDLGSWGAGIGKKLDRIVLDRDVCSARNILQKPIDRRGPAIGSPKVFRLRHALRRERPQKQ